MYNNYTIITNIDDIEKIVEANEIFYTDDYDYKFDNENDKDENSKKEITINRDSILVITKELLDQDLSKYANLKECYIFQDNDDEFDVQNFLYRLPKQIERLHIQEKRISSLTIPNHLVNLVDLTIYDVGLRKLKFDCQLNNLQRLNLSKNNLKSIPLL